MFNAIRFFQANRIRYVEAGQHHHSHQGWVQIDCPDCNEHEGYHLGWNLEEGYFNCWKCGKRSLWYILGRLLHTSDKSRVAAVVGTYDDGVVPRRMSPMVRKAVVEPPAHLGPMTRQHRQYLYRRNFDPDVLEHEWSLGGTTHLSGLWSWRVIIPINDVAGRIVAYQGRTIDDNAKPKYRTTDDKDMAIDPKSILYGIHKVPGDTILVVEGGTGAWRLGPGTVATLGIDWKVEQANQIRHYKRRFILFDPELKAQEQAEKLATWLSIFPGETEVLSGFRTDPGDFTDTQAERIVKSIGLRS